MKNLLRVEPYFEKLTLCLVGLITFATSELLPHRLAHELLKILSGFIEKAKFFNELKEKATYPVEQFENFFYFLWGYEWPKCLNKQSVQTMELIELLRENLNWQIMHINFPDVYIEDLPTEGLFPNRFTDSALICHYEDGTYAAASEIKWVKEVKELFGNSPTHVFELRPTNEYELTINLYRSIKQI
jgi:hypothetical protein